MADSGQDQFFLQHVPQSVYRRPDVDASSRVKPLSNMRLKKVKTTSKALKAQLEEKVRQEAHYIAQILLPDDVSSELDYDSMVKPILDGLGL